MFVKSLRDIFINIETKPLSIGGANDNPYIQELLRGEERRRERNLDIIFNRQNGYIR